MIPLLCGGAYRRPGTLLGTTIAAASFYRPRIISFKPNRDTSIGLIFKQAAAGTKTVDTFIVTGSTDQATVNTNIGSHPYDLSLGMDTLNEVQYVQSVDKMWLVHPSYKPKIVSGTSYLTMTINDFDSGLTTTSLMNAYPYLEQNTTATTIALNNAAVGTGKSLTVGAGTAIVFDSSWIGSLIKMEIAGTVGMVEVTAITSPTVAVVTVHVTPGATSATSHWWESAWSLRQGWPGSVAFFRNRLVYAGTSSRPDSVWFSRSFNYVQMSEDAVVDSRSPSTGFEGLDPFTIEISSLELNKIMWIVGGRTLVAGTQGSEYIIDNETHSTTDGFGVDNAMVLLESRYGSVNIQPDRGGDELYFVGRQGTEVKAYQFNAAESAFQGSKIQILYDEFPYADKHRLRQMRQVVWDEGRKTLWCIDTSGALRGLTRDKEFQVNAWSSHEMGGYDATKVATVSEVLDTTGPMVGAPAGSVVSMMIMPNPLTEIDDLWLVVIRESAGVYSYHVERMIGGISPFTSAYATRGVFDDAGVVADAGGGIHHVDAAVFSHKSTGTSFTGLSHINGKTPYGTAFNSNGIFSVHGTAVSGGSTAISGAPYDGLKETFFSVGLNFESVVAPVRPDAGSQIGTAQGALKRIHQVFIRFYKTLSAKVGRDADNLETIDFRPASTPMDSSAELFSGDKRVHLDSDWDRDGYVYILQDKPLPFCVAAIYSEGNTADG